MAAMAFVDVDELSSVTGLPEARTEVDPRTAFILANGGIPEVPPDLEGWELAEMDMRPYELGAALGELFDRGKAAKFEGLCARGMREQAELSALAEYKSYRTKPSSRNGGDSSPGGTRRRAERGGAEV